MLELFSSNEIIVSALPSYTSGNLHPVDCAIFPSFKTALRSVMADVMLKGDDKLLDRADICSILRGGFESSFTPEKSIAGFRKEGMFEVDASRGMCQPRPASHQTE